ISKSLAKYNQKGEVFVTDIVYYLKESLRSMNEQQQSNTFYPVLKAHSFPTTTNGEILVFDEHTAETRIFYAQDFGSTYKLVTETDLSKMEKSKEELIQMAAFSLRGLDYRYRKDEVAGNVFYFVSARDGYDASKLLNTSFIKTLTADFVGTTAVSIPHQDVLIVAELNNDKGYDVLAQLATRFFMEGTVPITALSFIYEDDELEPMFILGKKK
ncbi:MAG: DUF1444 family protein, partial [Bacilli bacterium]